MSLKHFLVFVGYPGAFIALLLWNSRGTEMTLPLIIGGAVLALFLGGWLLYRWLGRQADKSRVAYEQNVEPELRIIQGLPLEAAKERALKALSNAEQFDCVIAPVEHFNGESLLAPEIRGFFRHFASVRPKFGDLRLERWQVGFSEHWPGWVHIAWDEDDEILAKPDQEEVYVVYGGTKPGEVEPLPSVYHLILSDVFLLFEE